MVVLVDLDDNGLEPPEQSFNPRSVSQPTTSSLVGQSAQSVEAGDQLANPNLNSLFAASLSCYPCVLNICSTIFSADMILQRSLGISLVSRPE